MLTLEQAIERLIASRQFRDAWLRGDWSRVNVSEQTRTALQTIDPQSVVDAAILYRRDLALRGHRGSGRLVDLYAKTLLGVDLDELIDEFSESREYEEYRPFDSVATASLEDAFYRFCCSRSIGNPAVREHEFLEAMIRALVVNETPAFLVPDEFERCLAGWWAISTQSPPHLFAVITEKIVSGPVTELVSDLLRSSSSVEELAAQHDVGVEVALEAARFLEQLGLSSIKHPGSETAG